MLCGGTGPSTTLEEKEEQDLIKFIKESLPNENVDNVKILDVRSQVVAGMNYFVKVVFLFCLVKYVL